MGIVNDKLLDRVRKLVALAGSDKEEEARSSAVIACRMILKHGFVIAEKDSVAQRADRARGKPRYEREPHWTAPPQPRSEGPRSRNAPNDESGVGRGDFTTDTAILSHKQFRVAVDMARRYKDGAADAHQFFSRLQVESYKHSGVAKAYLGILREITSKG